jgi:hypothetical protein
VAAALFAAAPTVEAAAQFERDAVAAGAGIGNADPGQTG